MGMQGHNLTLKHFANIQIILKNQKIYLIVN